MSHNCNVFVRLDNLTSLMTCHYFVFVFKNVMEVVIDAPYTVTESFLNRFKVMLSLLLLEPVHEISINVTF